MMIYDEVQVNKMLQDERDKIKIAVDKEAQRQLDLHNVVLSRIAAALGLTVPATVEDIVAAIKKTA